MLGGKGVGGSYNCLSTLDLLDWGAIYNPLGVPYLLDLTHTRGERNRGEGKNDLVYVSCLTCLTGLTCLAQNVPVMDQLNPKLLYEHEVAMTKRVCVFPPVVGGTRKKGRRVIKERRKNKETDP